MKYYKRAMTIAGTDPSGGAGLQADMKTFAACGCYGTSVITAVVDQNTQGVNGVLPIPVEFVKGQIRTVLDDIGTDAIKIGMLHSSELIIGIRETLMNYPYTNIVLDPVMVATSGDKLLQDDAIETLKDVLIPFSRVITPNIPEAEVLLGSSIGGQKDLPEAAKELAMRHKVSVLLKAGHLTEDLLVDVFYNLETDEFLELPSQRIYTKNTHGTGCTFSSAIAAFLAKGWSLNESVSRGKDYMVKVIAGGADYQIGKGHGPVHHFAGIWEE